MLLCQIDSLVQPLAGHSRRRLSAGTDCLLLYLDSVFFRLKYCRLATDVLQIKSSWGLETDLDRRSMQEFRPSPITDVSGIVYAN